MPKLSRPVGNDIVKVLPVTPGAVAQVGLITAEMIDADVLAKPFACIPHIQFERAKALLLSAGLDYTDLTPEKWGLATRAMTLACFTEYAKDDRTRRLMKLQKCESDKDFSEKMQALYRSVCEAWGQMSITDPYYCGTGLESSPEVILEGKTRESPPDLMVLH